MTAEERKVSPREMRRRLVKARISRWVIDSLSAPPCTSTRDYVKYEILRSIFKPTDQELAEDGY